MAAPPVYIFNVESSRISGAKVNLVDKEIVQTWTADLHLAPSEKIIIVKGKPRHRKFTADIKFILGINSLSVFRKGTFTRTSPD